MNYDKTCQILLIGDSSVGKTSLIQRYANGIFKEEYLATVGLDFYTKQESINNINVLVGSQSPDLARYFSIISETFSLGKH